MDRAYGFGSFQFTFNGQDDRADGSGQTIAIIAAYRDPNLFNDLHTFDLDYGLPDPAITQTWFGTQPNDSWAQEEALVVEWAHAMAPGARILVVEAKDNVFSDLMAAVSYARSQPGVGVVSMSFGSSESSGESSYDGLFTTPAGHIGITFVAVSGDAGAWGGVDYPAASPNVLAVGGTTLRVDSAGDYLGETGWSGGTGHASTGGYSAFEPEPSYQRSVQGSGRRTDPDVSLDAEPNTGVYLVFTRPSTGRTETDIVGGTSASAPMWAVLIAIADQGHALGGRGTLDGARQLLPALYSSKMTGDFHDITQGFNGDYAGPGHDLVTGRGTPIALDVARDLIQVAPMSFTASLDAMTGLGAGQPGASTPRPDLVAGPASSPSATPDRDPFAPLAEPAEAAADRRAVSDRAIESIADDLIRPARI